MWVGGRGAAALLLLLVLAGGCAAAFARTFCLAAGVVALLLAVPGFASLLLLSVVLVRWLLRCRGMLLAAAGPFLLCLTQKAQASRQRDTSIAAVACCGLWPGGALRRSLMLCFCIGLLCSVCTMPSRCSRGDKNLQLLRLPLSLLQLPLLLLLPLLLPLLLFKTDYKT